jgi:hypothetical protein
LGVFVDPVVWSLAPLYLIFFWLGYSFAPPVLVSLAGNPSFSFSFVLLLVPL